MALYTIDLPDADEDGNFEFIADLDGSDFTIRLLYNDREERWYADIEDEDGTTIVDGVAVVVNWPLLRLSLATTRPDGELMCIDANADAVDPDIDTLNIDGIISYEDDPEGAAA